MSAVAVTTAHPLAARRSPMTERAARRPSRSERRIARRLNDGDPDVLRDIHAEHGGWVFGMLRRTLGDGAQAEDVFQVVMTEVWRRGATFDPHRASLETWIGTIARSRAIDALRRRRDVPLDPATLPDDGGEDAELDAVLDRAHLGALLDRLSADEREVLRLRFDAGHSQTEIAALTGVPLGTVKTRMVRALERLEGFMVAEHEQEARRADRAGAIR